MTEDETVGWHHWCNRQEFEQALKVGDGQGSLVCCSPWVTKSWTRLSNRTEMRFQNKFAGTRMVKLYSGKNSVLFRSFYFKIYYFSS